MFVDMYNANVIKLGVVFAMDKQLKDIIKMSLSQEVIKVRAANQF